LRALSLCTLFLSLEDEEAASCKTGLAAGKARAFWLAPDKVLKSEMESVKETLARSPPSPPATLAETLEQDPKAAEPLEPTVVWTETTSSPDSEAAPQGFSSGLHLFARHLTRPMTRRPFDSTFRGTWVIGKER
jgi:hypothetical protein